MARVEKPAGALCRRWSSFILSLLAPDFIVFSYLVNANQIRRLLGDHDRWRIGVTAHDRRHDRRVHDPQRLDSVHAEMWIDDRHLIVAHLARADGVPRGGGRAPHKRLKIRVASHIYTRCYLLPADVIKCLGIQNLEVPAYAGDGAPH